MDNIQTEIAATRRRAWQPMFFIGFLEATGEPAHNGTLASHRYTVRNYTNAKGPCIHIKNADRQWLYRTTSRWEMRLSLQCARLWRILSWYSQNQVTIKPITFHVTWMWWFTICPNWGKYFVLPRWHYPLLDWLPSGPKINSRLWVSLGRIWTHMHSPLISIFDNLIEMQKPSLLLAVLIPPEWPNRVAQFLDGVGMVAYIPLCLPVLPDLLTRPFYNTPRFGSTSI